MHHADGEDIHFAIGGADGMLLKRLQFVEFDTWAAGIRVLSKAVGHHSAYRTKHTLFGVNMGVAERPHIIQSTHMIVVLMREQDGIYVGDLMAERLLAEVRPAIYEQSQAVGFYQRAATQSCIA